MPSEQSPPSNSNPTRRGSAEKGQHPPITGGVRGLLGMPIREGGVLSTSPLTAPPRGHHYGQPLLSVSEENDEGFPEGARDEGSIEEGESAGAKPQRNVPHSLPPAGVSPPRVISENPTDARSTATQRVAEQREQTSFIIPGVSTHRTVFAALSHTSDTTKVTQPEESQEASPDKAAPLHASVSLPHPRETTLFDSEFLSRVEHLVVEDARARSSAKAQGSSEASRLPKSVEQMTVLNGERDDLDVARRLTQLQRTVSELAATVSAQAAHLRDESQAQGRERKTPPQRMVVVQRIDTSSTTPRAFWERNRLGRFYLKTGR